MSITDLTKKITEALGEDLSIQGLFGYLSEKVPENLIRTDDNKISLFLKDGKLSGYAQLWDGSNDEQYIELNPEDCKDKTTLLNKLKELEVFHPETVDIIRYKIDEDDDRVFLFGLVDPKNPKLHITRQSGGRGTTVTFIFDASDDKILNAIHAAGMNIKDYEIVKETSKGTLISARVRPYDNKKAFLFKDGKVRPAAVATLLQIIKEL